MRRESSQKLIGNDQFEGYAIDLIYEISKLLRFNYTLKLVPDGRYGSYNEDTKEWDGMMGELLQQVNFKLKRLVKIDLLLSIKLIKCLNNSESRFSGS